MSRHVFIATSSSHPPGYTIKERKSTYHQYCCPHPPYYCLCAMVGLIHTLTLIFGTFMAMAGFAAGTVCLVGRRETTAKDYDALVQAIRLKGHFAEYRTGDRLFHNATAVVLLPGSDWQVETGDLPVLVIAAEMDGVARFSSFAAARHRDRHIESKHFVVVEGASHHSFDEGQHTTLLDLRPRVDNKSARERAADLIDMWLSPQNNDGLFEAERRAAELAEPIVKALQLEGSPHLGKDICNSDFPTNPTCNYPKYPDFSLPPGPAPEPSPLPSKDCICGSEWVTEYAFPEVSGASEKGFKVHVADAFHDVSDVHPFHLPHTWNKCSNPQGCTLNVTTLTMLWNESGSLFPNASSPPLSALELRTKMKSRKTVWEAAGLGKQSGDVDKKNLTLCKSANQLAWDWALENADSAVRSRFEQHGEPFVMVDDVEAPIGVTGPEWIKKTLVFNRNSQSKSIEVQSWMFVVGESPIKTKYLPTGMHYCKLLSPARCMEWIYTDGLRNSLGVRSE